MTEPHSPADAPDTPDVPDASDTSNQAALATEAGGAMGPDDFDALEDLLDDMRGRAEEIPQWEFCEGFLAAVVCSRRSIPLAEALPVLLGEGEAPDADQPHQVPRLPAFADADQQARFIGLWLRRQAEVEAALSAKVETLDDERTYQPEVMDVRGAVAALPDAERAKMGSEDLPSFAQVWALGFMFAIESWPEEWTPPRDKQAAAWLDESLDAIVALTEDDTGVPTISMHSEDGAPSLSQGRIDAFGEAIWAVYDLRQLWGSLGPRVEAVRRAATPGRNDPCPCGSGKKYKKCHGA